MLIQLTMFSWVWTAIKQPLLNWRSLSPDNSFCRIKCWIAWVTRDHICLSLWVKSALKRGGAKPKKKKLLSDCKDWISVELTWSGGGTVVKAGVYWDVCESVHVVFINGLLQRDRAELANLLTEGQACLLGGLATHCKRWSKSSRKGKKAELKYPQSFGTAPIPHLLLVSVLVMWGDMEVFV